MPHIRRRPRQEVETPRPGVKLLIDNHLSHRLIPRLQDLFPSSAHVKDLLGERARDPRIRQAALEGGFIILTADKDFVRLATDHGHPPKTILVNLGTPSNADVEALLREHADLIRDFAANSAAPLMELPRAVNPGSTGRLTSPTQNETPTGTRD